MDEKTNEGNGRRPVINTTEISRKRAVKTEYEMKRSRVMQKADSQLAVCSLCSRSILVQSSFTRLCLWCADSVSE